MTWKCPKCGSDSLEVTVTVVATLHQYGEDNFETEVVGDHEWDNTSFMQCKDCNHCGNSGQFAKEAP